MLTPLNLYQLKTIFPAFESVFADRHSLMPAIFSDWIFKKKKGGNLSLVSRFEINHKPLGQIELAPDLTYFSPGHKEGQNRAIYLTSPFGDKYEYWGWRPVDLWSPFYPIYENAFIGLSSHEAEQACAAVLQFPQA